VQNKNMQSELKPLISDPGWQILVRRLEYIQKQADVNLHNVKTFEEFLSARGELKMADRILQLFQNPTQLSDDGVYKMQVPGIENAL
jgi:hypothetical protein